MVDVAIRLPVIQGSVHTGVAAQQVEELQRAEPQHGDLDGLLSPQARTATVASSAFRFADPSQALIFLDWDDTLFPTSHLFDGWGLPSRPNQWDRVRLTDEQQLALESWQQALSLYIKTACTLSERCVIVTNANLGWIESCINRFAPSLQNVMSGEHGPRVVYAKEVMKNQQRSAGSARGNPTRYPDESLAEEELDDKLTKAKCIAMRQEAKQFYSQYPRQTWKNIISIGDTKYEHDAAQEVAFRRKSRKRERLRLKTVITPKSPTIQSLTYRLRLSTVMLRAYVYLDDDMDVDTNDPEQLLSLGKVLQMPELSTVFERVVKEDLLENPTEEVKLKLADVIDEVAILIQNRLFE